MAKVIQAHEFDAEVLNSTLPVVVDVYADWCGPCRMVAPVFEATSKKWSSVCTFVKLNIDESQVITRQFGVSSIPAFLFFSQGQLRGMSVGYKDQRALEQEMGRFLGLVGQNL